LTNLADLRHPAYPRRLFEPQQSREPRRVFESPRPHEKRHRPMGYGKAMTIAIVAKSIKHKCFISVSDRMVFFDDQVPAIDNAVIKDLQIRIPNWNMVFSGNTEFVLPIWQGAVSSLASATYQPSLMQVEEAVCSSYSEVLQKHVTRQYLTKFGFRTIHDFRNAGASQLGRRFYGSLTRKIDRFNADVDFIVYGFDHTANKSPHMFKVTNPGNAINLDHLKSYAIGSGTHMAIASLNLRPLDNLSAGALAYRLCEAKFSAETATGVGKTTTGFFMNMHGYSSPITPGTIDKFRDYWKKWKMEPPPAEVIDSIVELPDGPDDAK
jgi:hypothetical protein